MADRLSSRDTGEELHAEEPASPPGLPRWVKLGALAVALLILLAVAISFLGGIQHGPGLHGPTTSGGWGSTADLSV